MTKTWGARVIITFNFFSVTMSLKYFRGTFCFVEWVFANEKPISGMAS